MTGKYALDPATRVLLADVGIDSANVLRRAGLPADLLARGAVWLTEDEFFTYWRSIEEESGDPKLPLRLAESFSADAFAPPIFAALVSPDLNTAALRLQKYKALIGPMRLRVDIDTASTRIELVWPSGPPGPSTLTLMELLFWVALVRAGTRHRVPVTAMTMPDPPADVDAYREYLGIEIRRSQVVSVGFSAIDARRPFLTANDGLWQGFEPELRRRLGDLDRTATMADRVRAVLVEALPSGDGSMGAVAARLAMSPRTLQRRLQGEDTTFQRVLDATRESLARHYLTDHDLSAGEISFLLGFEETSSFYRAFHQWTGETPERVRAAIA